MSQEEAVDKSEEQQKAPQMDIKSVLFSMPGAPTQEVIEKWKVEHGEVLVYGFSPTELYVFRPLAREEYVNLQVLSQQKQQQGEVVDAEAETVDICVLWPKEPSGLKKKAGTVTSLYERIMQDSNFVPTHLAPYLVVKL